MAMQENARPPRKKTPARHTRRRPRNPEASLGGIAYYANVRSTDVVLKVCDGFAGNITGGNSATNREAFDIHRIVNATEELT